MLAALFDLKLPSISRLVTIISVENAVRYTLFAGVAWLFGYVLFKKRWSVRKIIPKMPEGSDVRREILWSLSTVVIYGFVGMATLIAAKHGWTQMYWKVGQHSGWWFAASIAITIVVHDTIFYWSHRIMHHKKLFRLFHRTHHLSNNPSPWAAYAFSPLEAVVESAIFPVIVVLIPIHPGAFGLFMVWQITFNVLGHTGYEYHPRWLMDSWLGKIINTPTNHVMHHETMRGNFGLYFNVWDRLMGTNHPNYEQRFREVTTRSEGEAKG